MEDVIQLVWKAGIAASVLNMECSPLEHPLKCWSLLRLDWPALRHLLDFALQERLEVSLEGQQIAANCTECVGRGGVMEEREQHMLQSQELVAPLCGFLKGAGEGDAQIISEVHSGSVVQRRG